MDLVHHIGETIVKLRSRVTCPHCWHGFAPYDALWISEHSDLLGDVRLGPDQQQRFLPDRFSPSGAALDARDVPCHRLACPGCHLEVPPASFELAPLFLSTLGAPACGKSYFLTAMTWTLRWLLPKRFALSIADADNLLNARIQQYESLQFLNADTEALVELPKTETHGDLYSTVLWDGQPMQYLKPFVFKLVPSERHPHAKAGHVIGRMLCLYDNAGESFLPGHDTVANPVTRHLAASDAVFFLLDPTQDPRFRRAARGKSQDPQMAERSGALPRESTLRQETILHEAAERIRRYGDSARRTDFPPLIVVVTKYDAWSQLLSCETLPQVWDYSPAVGICGVRIGQVEEISRQLRGLLQQLCPETVGVVEALCADAVYVPVSATGCSPEVDPQTGRRGFRPRNIRPIWVETPMLYFLTRWARGLVGHFTRPQSPPARWASPVTTWRQTTTRCNSQQPNGRVPSAGRGKVNRPEDPPR